MTSQAAPLVSEVMESMPVTMICPNLKCGRTVIAPDAARGKVVRCAHCQHVFLVPARPSGATPVPVEPDSAKKGKKQPS